MKLPSISVRRPVTTAMLFFVILLIGGVCFVMLPVDLFPEMDIPSITVVTIYEGASPEDVESKVTKELEDALATVPDLKHIVSRSKEGVSIIILSFEWGTNLDTRANDIRDSVSQVKWRLPEDIEDPRTFQMDISRFPILVFGFSAKESFDDLEDILKDTIADPLRRVSGVGAAPVYISTRRQVNVWLDRDRLASYNLTPQDVVRAISQENQTLPAGNIKIGLIDYLIRVPGEFKHADEMTRIVLTAEGGRIVRLPDVAVIQDSFEDPPSQIVRVNGGKGAMVIVQKQSGANTVDVAKAVKKKLPELAKRLPPDVKSILLFDQSEQIVQMAGDLSEALFEGGLLAVAVVLFFLRRVRLTLVIALTIPFSLILGLISMYFLNYTINMITMFAMIVAVGRVVDDAIVILENITRHREEGERANEAAVYGSGEVGMAVTSSTLTTVCVFFPILFVKGLTRVIFTQFAVIVVIVLLSSLLAALTLTPMLASKILRGAGGRQHRFFDASERAFRRFADFYARILAWCLRHRAVILTGAALVFVSSLGLIPLIGTEFFPQEDSSFVRGTVYMPVGTPVEETNRVMVRIESILREDIGRAVGADKIIALDTSCGQSSSGISFMGDEGPHIGSFMVKLVRKELRSQTVDQLCELLRKRLNAIQAPENIEKFQIAGNDPMAGLILGGERPVTINVYGEDLDQTGEMAERLRRVIEKIPGTTDVAVSRVKGRPELIVKIDRDKASAMGLDEYQIADTVRASFYGRTATKFRARREEYDIFVRFREEDRSVKTALLATPLRLPSGRIIRAGDVIQDLYVDLGPLEIERKDKGRVVNVGCNLYGRSMGDVVSDLKAELAKINVPRGVELQMAGQTEDMGEAFRWLFLAFGVAFLLVYMIMASQFESLVDPFIIMFSVPFALTGVLIGVFLSGYSISIVTLIGMLMLIGIVVNNAIVLVDYTNILRARDVPMAEAIQQAGRARLRPVLMTALTTVFAVLPMAFASGQGSETWNPLGMAILGGLLVSTFVTLLLVPTVYSFFRRVRV